MGIEALLIGGLAVVALTFATLWRQAESRRAAGLAENGTLRAEREDLSTRLERERKARAKQDEELAGFRKRADKVRRREARAEKGTAQQPLGTTARMADLEEQVERVERERDRSRTEREQLAARVAELEAQLDTLRQTRSAPAPVAARVVAETPAEVEGTDALAAAQERLAKLEEQLEGAKLNEARMRKRMTNQEQLYASIRSELEVKKDRLRTQEETIQRLQALQVVVDG